LDNYQLLVNIAIRKINLSCLFAFACCQLVYNEIDKWLINMKAEQDVLSIP